MNEKSEKPLIEAHRVTRILPLEVPVTLVKDVSLTIYPGEFISITGPSGSGKSSLLYLLGLLDRPTEGDIIVDGVSTSAMTDKEMGNVRLEKMGFVFQFHFLLAEFTVMENVMIPMHRLGKWTPAERREKAGNLLEELGMADQMDKLPYQLSGGQRQRVALARAMANEPKIILADEPTGNLDTKNSKVVHDMFKHLVKEHGTAVVMVTHDMALAQDTDRRLHLIDGALQ